VSDSLLKSVEFIERAYDGNFIGGLYSLELTSLKDLRIDCKGHARQVVFFSGLPVWYAVHDGIAAEMSVCL
jgi:hypothetical protein